MASGDYSHDKPRRAETFGQLVAKIIGAPTSTDRDYASHLAEEFYDAETKERRDALMRKNLRRSYDFK